MIMGASSQCLNIQFLRSIVGTSHLEFIRFLDIYGIDSIIVAISQMKKLSGREVE